MGKGSSHIMEPDSGASNASMLRWCPLWYYKKTTKEIIPHVLLLFLSFFFVVDFFVSFECKDSGYYFNVFLL